ncbi:glutathione S-transferase family protein [Abyssibacter profundi]|uniref:GST N-terminal domain-containing protein n=1 Tax=Abyssibacter profundi TaxID=2182787 RepID=A0A363UJB8_9GAMM|nr:glutathione S-transferase N-terminal domain-containing protein [Abyssibacter profundi]PWN55523.1 hypothetical protein DEH80_12085 [Abyssibacter profundi]
MTPDTSKPTLYWISGSPPAWQVMLGLTLKRVKFDSALLDVSRRKIRQLAYLGINPTGRVPTLLDGDVVVQESIAILAYLDRSRPDRPLYGATPAQTATVWQE